MSKDMGISWIKKKKRRGWKQQPSDFSFCGGRFRTGREKTCGGNSRHCSLGQNVMFGECGGAGVVAEMIY